MKFSEEEIAKSKELKRLGLLAKISLRPQIGTYLWARDCPEGCVAATSDSDAKIFLITEVKAAQSECLWLPTFDELLTVSRELAISFSQVTDYLHRKRFSDGKEREGLLQLLIEQLR